MSWKELTKEEVAEFQRVLDWLNDVSRRRTGSEATRERYLNWLTDYCNYRKLSPEQLLAEGDKIAPGKKRMTLAEYNLNRYFTYLERERGLKRGTAKTRYGTLRSFLKSGEIAFYGKTPGGVVVQRSVELPKDRLIELVQAATSREAYVICGLASTGMRPGDFAKLTYGDIQSDYEAGEERLYIEKESEKEDLPFGVFLGRQATRFLRMYVEERKRKGEEITEDTFLLGHEHPGRASEEAGYGRFQRGKPITTQQLRNILKRAAGRVGLELTPKLFRKNFRTNASPEIGRDAVQKMAAWTIPGAGKHYFLPPRSKCLELYRKIEHFFTYEQVDRRLEDERRRAITILEKAGIDWKAVLRSRKVKTTEEEVRALNEMIGELLKLKKEPIGGGLPFEVAARKALADILVGAVEDVKKRLAEKS